jgi:hypothetical protein
MREMAELFLREATARLDCPETLIAHRIFGVTCWYLGDFAGAHEHFRKTVELYDPARHSDFANRFGQDPRASAKIYDAITQWVLGRVDEALNLADRALIDAESVAHAPTMANALLRAASLGLYRCNPEAVATYCKALADLASRYDLPAFWIDRAVFFQGWAKWSDGADESSLAEMRRGLAISRGELSAAEAALALAEASTGETDGGLRRLDDALAELERTENRSYKAEMHRIRGEIFARPYPSASAFSIRQTEPSGRSAAS